MGCLFATKDDIEDFDSYCMQDHPLYLMINCAHPLAQQDYVRITDLKQLPLLSQGSQFSYHNFLVKKCHENGFEPRIIHQTYDLTAIINMVEHGKGASLILLMSSDMYRGNSCIRLLPFEETDMRWQAYIIKSKERVIPQHFKNYWELCKQISATDNNTRS